MDESKLSSVATCCKSRNNIVVASGKPNFVVAGMSLYISPVYHKLFLVQVVIY